MMKILVGYDGSECADVALDDLTRAGLPDGGEMLVLSVADVWPHLAAAPTQGMAPGWSTWMLPAVESATEVSEHELTRAATLATRGADRLRERFPAWQVRADAAADSPQWGLIKRADEWKPDLVVVGSHGKSAVGRVVLGSVSQSVLLHAGTSVRIARRAPRDSGTVRLLIGVDGSVGSAAAVQALGARKWPAGTEVRVLAAIDTSAATSIPVRSVAAPYERPSAGDPRDWVAHFAHQVARELTESQLSASPVVRQADPRRALIEEAQRWEADCIFVGAKGMSRLERFLLGSVSASVAARAHCTVEVVRHPGDAT